jgi:glycosyltransferase involved in cell wall biosynthesis
VVAAAPQVTSIPTEAVSQADLDPGAVGAALQLPSTFVLAVGEVQPRKNLVRLIEAMALARRRGLDAGLVIGGPRGWRAGEVDLAIERHDASGWVRMLGYVPPRTLAVLYRTARLVAFLSMYEGFGIPVLEAMAAGTPVVASRTGSIPEVAGDGARLVDATDAQEIANAIALVATDQDIRTSLVAAGSRRVEHYRSDGSVRAVIGAYERALDR